MNKFKIGDTVVRTDCDWSDCIVGKRYTVCHVGSRGLVLTEVQGSYDPNYFELATDYPNPPHKHADLIIAWAKGAVIEHLNIDSGVWKVLPHPLWDTIGDYRIKPTKSAAEIEKDDIRDQMAVLSDRLKKLEVK